MPKYGKSSWGDKPGQGAKSKYNNDRMMKLQDGQNKVRIITDPYRFLYHKEEFANDPSKFGRKIRCATDGCPLCASGSKVKEGWVVGVIDRATNTYKLLEIGSKIYTDIQGIMETEGYENLQEYDLIIKKNPKGGASNFYQVLPGKKAPLSADDVEKVDQINEAELDEFINPISAEDVTNSIIRIKNWIAKQLEKDGGGNGGSGEDDDAPPQQKQRQAAKTHARGQEPQADKAVTEDMFDFKDQ